MFACKANRLARLGFGNGRNLVGDFTLLQVVSLVGKAGSYMRGSGFWFPTPTIRRANIIMMGGRNALEWKGQQITRCQSPCFEKAIGQ